MDALPQDVKSQLEQMQNNLGSLEAALAPFLKKTPAEIDASFDPVQRAQVYTTLAQAAASLFSLYLKAKGVDPADHPFNKEHDRLKQYNKKVRKIAAVEELNRNRPTLEVDVAAMSRFIAAAVPDLNAAQREELKQVGKKDKAQREQEREERAAAKRRKKSGGGGNNANSSDAALAFLHETLGEVKPSKTPSGK